jgi:hypothetical protein
MKQRYADEVSDTTMTPKVIKPKNKKYINDKRHSSNENVVHQLDFESGNT